MATKSRMSEESFAQTSERGRRMLELAATADTDTSESALETVVVTGSAIASSVTKLEASYNIVTATEEQIREPNPKSTADLLKISPGLWPESTGGQTGANVEIAGFAGGGDAPYFTTLLMGSPLYADAVVLRDQPHLSARHQLPGEISAVVVSV